MRQRTGTPSRQQPLEDRMRQEFENFGQFMMQIGEVPMAIPEAVMNSVCAQAGLSTTDERVTQILNLECHKYIVELILDLTARDQPNQIDTTDKTVPEVITLPHVKALLSKRQLPMHRPAFIVGELEKTPPHVEPLNQLDPFGSNDMAFFM